MKPYKHPTSRGFSIGIIKEGATRLHFSFWKWEWSKWINVDKIDDNHTETFFKQKLEVLSTKVSCLEREIVILRKYTPNA